MSPIRVHGLQRRSGRINVLVLTALTVGAARADEPPNRIAEAHDGETRSGMIESSNGWRAVPSPNQPAPAGPACCPDNMRSIFADNWVENTTPFFFFWEGNPMVLNYSATCGTVSPVVANPIMATPTLYYSFTEYRPCENECQTVDVSVRWQGTGRATGRICLERRIDLCLGESFEACVCTSDANGEDAALDVATQVVPPEAGSLSRTSGRSTFNSDAGCFLFCTTYTAGELKMDKVRVKLFDPADPERRLIYSFDNLGCCDHSDCDDGEFCNGPESCVAGACVAGADPCPGQVCCADTQTCHECCSNQDCPNNGLFCDGAESCVGRQCVSAGDPCPAFVPVCCESKDNCFTQCCEDADCTDNGIFCDGPRVCLFGACVPGAPPCSGATPLCCEASSQCAADCCTDDQCADDGIFCNGDEVCIGGDCTSNGNPCDAAAPLCCSTVSECRPECCADTDCDDANACTADSCDANGACLFDPSPVGTACGDPSNDACDAADSCDGAGACRSNHAAVGNPCDDGLFCTGIDSCAGGVCTAGTTPCTDPDLAFCNEPANECMDGCTQPAQCDDGNPCTQEFCDVSGQCSNPPWPPGRACGSADNTDCTDPDTCDGAGLCRPNHASDGVRCEDGVFCTGNDTCRSGACQPGPSPCAGTGQPFCRESVRQCASGCLSPSDCTDGNECTSDSCQVDGVCSFVPRPVRTACGDSTDNPCTDPDTCDGAGACVVNNAADGTSCPDDRFCNGEEVCRSGTCQSRGSPCDPGFVCSESGDACRCDSNADCDDDLFCNGRETCDDGVCIDGTPPCSGGSTCDEEADECFCVVAADCDDSDFCNGQETCTDDGACRRGLPPDCRSDSAWMNGFCDLATNACAADVIARVVVRGPEAVAPGGRSAFASWIEWDDGSPSGEVTARTAWSVLDTPDAESASGVASMSADGILSIIGFVADGVQVWVAAVVRDEFDVELRGIARVTIRQGVTGDVTAAGSPVRNQGCGPCGALDAVSAMILLVGLFLVKALPVGGRGGRS
ncbi:MAG: hypothetical protein HOP29_06840 [Phycisphaerales bacterium]|nr:hypothetical protein [Phycisphaerales bacterium]